MKMKRETNDAHARLAALERHSAEPEQDLVLKAFAELDAALEALRTADRALREQNELLAARPQEVERERRRYQDLLAFAPDGYLVTDLRGVIREANRAAARLLGIPEKSLVGQPLGGFVEEKGHPTLQRRLLRLGQTGGLQEWEGRVCPPQSAPFDAWLRVAPVRGIPEEPPALRWLVRDITCASGQSMPRAGG